MRWTEHICSKMQTIGNCVSVAARQSREAEVDVISKRRFRQMLASGEASIALPQEENTGVREVMARTKIGGRSFLDCINDAKNQVEWGRFDVSARRFYQKLPE